MRIPTPLVARMVAVGMLAAAGTAGAAPKGRVNDTGMHLCANYADILPSACTGEGQDAEAGRDVTRPNERNGRLGFAFVKVAADGTALKADAPEWDCLLDKVTGLMWEIKSGKGIHSNRRFTNQGDTHRLNDVAGYLQRTNGEALCGATDWRLPLLQEFYSIFDYGRRQESIYFLDPAWFVISPTAPEPPFWLGEASIPGATTATALDIGGGEFTSAFRNTFHPAFFVHQTRPGSDPAPPRFNLQDGEAIDRFARLVWRRCVEGMVWDGGTCAGTPALTYWWPSLLHAQDEAARTGQPWRMPNAKELQSLVDLSSTSGVRIDAATFPAAPGSLQWTATPRRSVNFSGGGITSSGLGQYPSRLVRELGAAEAQVLDRDVAAGGEASARQGASPAWPLRPGGRGRQ